MDSEVRQKIFYAMTAAVTIATGLVTRAFKDFLPSNNALYGGDTLWAMMVDFWAAVLFTSWSPLRILFLSIIFSFSIEVSQLYHSPLIDTLRSTLPGRLVPGQGFLVSDFFCYSVGACGAFFCDRYLVRRFFLP